MNDEALVLKHVFEIFREKCCTHYPTGLEDKDILEELHSENDYPKGYLRKLISDAKPLVATYIGYDIIAAIKIHLLLKIPVSQSFVERTKPHGTIHLNDDRVITRFDKNIMEMFNEYVEVPSNPLPQSWEKIQISTKVIRPIKYNDYESDSDEEHAPDSPRNQNKELAEGAWNYVKTEADIIDQADPVLPHVADLPGRFRTMPTIDRRPRHPVVSPKTSPEPSASPPSRRPMTMWRTERQPCQALREMRHNSLPKCSVPPVFRDYSPPHQGPVTMRRVDRQLRRSPVRQATPPIHPVPSIRRSARIAEMRTRQI